MVEEFRAAARAEPGNGCFDWYRSSDDPNQWSVVEAFRDAEAGRVHVESDHFHAAIARLASPTPDRAGGHQRRGPTGAGWSHVSELKVEPAGP